MVPLSLLWVVFESHTVGRLGAQSRDAIEEPLSFGASVCFYLQNENMGTKLWREDPYPSSSTGVCTRAHAGFRLKGGSHCLRKGAEEEEKDRRNKDGKRGSKESTASTTSRSRSIA